MTQQVDHFAKIVWDYMLMHQELRPMDAIFALGSNDTRVAERAAELYLQGYGKYIICAGGNGKGSDFSKPEAEVFSEVIINQGVPAEKIILESNSTNTGENVVFVKRLLKEKGLNFRSFLLVQKPYMERRTFATFRKQWPEPECIVTSPQLSYEEYTGNDVVFKERFMNVMVGDLQRIREYPKLGFQIEQEIPEEVWQAWEELIKLGYTKYFLQPR
jgi:uncharacterized SAM-binding protein YcdF (DUF218 family)